MTGRPPRSPLFPHTTLFRSIQEGAKLVQRVEDILEELNLTMVPQQIDRKSTRLNSSHSQISHSPPFFFLNDRPPPEISPLPPHDALPIYPGGCEARAAGGGHPGGAEPHDGAPADRSEEHTSELQSQSNLPLPSLFFFK